MQIMNTFVAKIGPAGKRNRAARRKHARVVAYHQAQGYRVDRSKKSVSTVPHALDVAAIVKAQEKVDFSGNWDENIARKALETFAKSGQSQRSFSAEHQFPESRLRSWKKKLTIEV